MGIPVISLFDTYTLASKYPYWTAFVGVLLVMLAWWMFRFTKRHPKQLGRLRLVMAFAYLAVTLPLLWAGFRPHETTLAQMMPGAQAEYAQAFRQALDQAEAK